MKYEHLLKVIKVADHLGVDIIRTYIPITLNSIEERRTGGERSGPYDTFICCDDSDCVGGDIYIRTMNLNGNMGNEGACAYDKQRKKRRRDAVYLR